MADTADSDPEDEFRDMLRELLSSGAPIDPAKFAGAAGLPTDPATMSQLLGQLHNAMRDGNQGINWDLATDQAKSLAQSASKPIPPHERADFEQAARVAALWLDEVTQLSELNAEPTLISRTEWVTQTMPIWSQLSEPVATSISDSLTHVLEDQAPEEMQGMIHSASQLMRSIGGTLFAMQLGHVVGQLATEVVSGGDVGIPLLNDGHAALLPQNVAEFGDGLDIPPDQVQLYLLVRELAHARLFRHAKWLRLHVMTTVADYARGVRIDTDRLAELAEDFDPANPEELRQAMVSGALIPPKSESQLAALARLETILALIEGWVDVTTAEATSRLPKAAAIAETVRRRRATGGPAESAFATLVGLELRPRRLREAAMMWQTVTDAVGRDGRDDLWSHPDLIPTSDDIDDPSSLVERVTALTRGEKAPPDDFDRALEDFWRDEDDGTGSDTGEKSAPHE